MPRGPRQGRGLWLERVNIEDEFLPDIMKIKHQAVDWCER
jgi:hypothetical protein